MAGLNLSWDEFKRAESLFVFTQIRSDMSTFINYPLPQRTESCEMEEINLEMDESKRMGPKSAALKTRPVAYMRNVLEAFRRNFYWQILCTPGLFYGKFKSTIISKSLIYTSVSGKCYCFRLLVPQSRHAVTLTSLLQGNKICAKSCNMLAKQERTGPGCLKGKKKKSKEKYYWNTYAILAVKLDKKWN